ncbi:hypothetical protein TVAGG3_0076670 [Trichomonas vaginalis G3]|uniref:hypothetical protein n=1 Tax=Trichomonas vaginalis (strain ATCC PRA-98 / G3) TaxID=412133 RepID=UPI0021E538F3|nr:hypothetical protein TVAGG3_0076670 [Trichomonas vaginalis G3]KAI5542918.1 hypothetical protein TVAGG3_0076670 [Trichomonas vaginalis G3]
MGRSVQVYIDNFVKSKELPPPSQKAAVFQYLDKLRIDAAASRMYKDACQIPTNFKRYAASLFREREMEKMRTHQGEFQQQEVRSKQKYHKYATI